MIIKYKFANGQLGLSRDNTRKFYYVDIPKDTDPEGDFWSGVELGLAVAGVRIDAFVEAEE